MVFTLSERRKGRRRNYASTAPCPRLEVVAAEPQRPWEGGRPAVRLVVLTMDWLSRGLLDFRALHDDRARGSRSDRRARSAPVRQKGSIPHSRNTKCFGRKINGARFQACV